MSIRARRGGGAPPFIWPGFVDALATLLLVIVFVVLALAAAQVYLAQAVDDRDAALADRRAEIAAQEQALAEQAAQVARQRAELGEKSAALAALDARVAALAEALNLSEAESADREAARRRLTAEAARLQADLRAAEDAQAGLQGRLDAAAAANADLQGRLDAAAAAQAQLRSDLEAAQAARAAADDDAQAVIDALNAAAGAAGLTADEALLVLTENLKALRDETARLADALDAAEAEIEAKTVEIVSLGDRLNRALADKVAELQRYRSAFFGQLRDVLGERDDIRIAGDRFVFQAEVLFRPGAADLGPDGAAAIAALVAGVAPLIDDIPAEFDWYLRVDGHTDDQPISNERFQSNWALSTARALSVVDRMIALGFPADRLAAAGFGEFRPRAPNAAPAERARNRRIEIVLDQRPPAVTSPAVR